MPLLWRDKHSFLVFLVSLVHICEHKSTKTSCSLSQRVFFAGWLVWDLPLGSLYNLHTLGDTYWMWSVSWTSWNYFQLFTSLTSFPAGWNILLLKGLLLNTTFGYCDPFYSFATFCLAVFGSALHQQLLLNHNWSTRLSSVDDWGYPGYFAVNQSMFFPARSFIIATYFTIYPFILILSTPFHIQIHFQQFWL